MSNTEENSCKTKKNSVHLGVGFIFIILLVGLFSIVYLIDGILPTPLQLNDEETHPDAFITSRASEDLKVLVKDIGSRLTGSHNNEVLTVAFLIKAINDIQKQAHPNKQIEVDIQSASGSYYLNTMPAIVTYQNVQNIVVKLYSEISTNYSLLLNSHFDTVPISPGGSDDGINCVVMLEILRKCSQSSEKFQHNIIFLFNGAEETPLQASHGFITQHKWAKEVKVVINLDSAGAGGKALLFQTGPDQPWLMNYFKKVAYPGGSVVAEELFQSGIVPSDTDFRNFRDFGDVVGYDFAFSKNAHRYHTKFDRYENIPGGSYQQIGENTLRLTRFLANALELKDIQKQSKGKMIYYDVFSLFVVAYSTRTATAINIIISLLSIVVALIHFYIFGFKVQRSTFKYLTWMLGAIILGWIVSITVVVIIGFILDAVKFSMRWYNNYWIVLGLYALPVIICCGGITTLFNRFHHREKLHPANNTQIQIQLVRLIWTMLLLIGTIMRVRSVYVIFLQIFFQTIAFVIIQVTFSQRSLKRWYFIFILGSIFPTMHIMQLGLNMSEFLIPVSGRIGPNRNPELEIAVITALLTIIITSFFIPLITLLRKPHILLISLGTVFVIFLIITLTPIAFPYSGDDSSPAPQRYWIHHMDRTFRNDSNNIYKKDSGYFVLNMDRNSPDTIRDIVDNFQKAEAIDDDCKNSLFCGLPLGRFKIFGITWIPAEPPLIPEPITLSLNSKTTLTDTLTRFHFTASGPNRFELYISPRNGVNIANISLIPKLPQNIKLWNGRPLLTIMHTWGKNKVPLTFSVDIETPPNYSNPKFDIAIAGRYLDNAVNIKTQQYTEFLSKFPEWTDVEPWLGAYESWVY